MPVAIVLAELLTPSSTRKLQLFSERKYSRNSCKRGYSHRRSLRNLTKKVTKRLEYLKGQGSMITRQVQFLVKGKDINMFLSSTKRKSVPDF